jgi:hypothetical protein
LPDGIADLVVCTRAEDAVAALDGLTRAARSAKAAGDPRSLAQLRADLAIDLLTGTAAIAGAGVAAAGGDVSGDRPTAAAHRAAAAESASADPDDDAVVRNPGVDAASAGTGVPIREAKQAASDDGSGAEATGCHQRWGWPRPVEVQVVVGADSLFGDGDQPGLLRGYGSISPQLARHLACAEQVWLRQLVADPRDGHLVGMSSRTRLFRGELRAYLQAHDQGCAVNPCGRPGEHADHVTSYAAGGSTSIGGGQLLCAGDNQAKQHADVTVTRHADDSTTWVMPSERAYVQHPPPVLGYGTGDPPWHRMYDDPDEDQGDTDDLSPPF